MCRQDQDHSRWVNRPWNARFTAVKLFLTCWIVYSLHFSTDIVREIYPALALGDHFSFRLDEYGGMHPDLFETTANMNRGQETKNP